MGAESALRAQPGPSEAALTLFWKCGALTFRIGSFFAGMRSPLGDSIRSESVAGMDMLNDMFQRQVGRRATARARVGGKTRADAK